MTLRLLPALLAVLAGTLLGGCGAAPPDHLQVTELARYPHDAAAFTQGLLWHDGAMYESTGLYGRSSLRRVDLESGVVERIRYLADDEFAEGLARVGDQLIQLTWRAGRAHRWPLASFDLGGPPLATHGYRGEGWGLCFDGERLVMSDGSTRLQFRDPATFALLGTVEVRLAGEPLARLNELECVGDDLWANIWYDDRIVRIDPDSGRVEAWADLSGLLDPTVRSELGPDAVLNGLAWRPESGTMLATGKLWPVVIELRIQDVRP